LAPGDSLVLYTDGVTDVPGDGGLSTELLQELLTDAARSAATADELATAVGVRLERIRPRRLRSDDIALVIAMVPAR
jgi:serine phosphatase RsbU (regulator of sigma subunit)